MKPDWRDRVLDALLRFCTFGGASLVIIGIILLGVSCSQGV